jgi:hypothetical protein
MLDNKVMEVDCPTHGRHSGYVQFFHGQTSTCFCTRCLMDLLERKIGSLDLLEIVAQEPA